MKYYIPYLRVSTEEQGDSKLGLESQRTYIRDFVSSVNGEIIQEFEDIESGSKSHNRSGFNLALSLAKKTGATLVGYDIKRISRGGFRMIADLEDSKVKYIAAISPNESNLSKNIHFIIGKEYLDELSRNTKKALDVIKGKLERGETHISKSGRVVTRLGSPVPISRKAIENSAKVRSKRAYENMDNKKAGAFIIALRDKSNESFYSITKALNEAGFRTSRGNEFSQVSTKRMYDRYKN